MKLNCSFQGWASWQLRFTTVHILQSVRVQYSACLVRTEVKIHIHRLSEFVRHETSNTHEQTVWTETEPVLKVQNASNRRHDDPAQSCLSLDYSCLHILRRQ